MLEPSSIEQRKLHNLLYAKVVEPRFRAEQREVGKLGTRDCRQQPQFAFLAENR